METDQGTTSIYFSSKMNKMKRHWSFLLADLVVLKRTVCFVVAYQRILLAAGVFGDGLCALADSVFSQLAR